THHQHRRVLPTHGCPAKASGNATPVVLSHARPCRKRYAPPSCVPTHNALVSDAFYLRTLISIIEHSRCDATKLTRHYTRPAHARLVRGAGSYSHIREAGVSRDQRVCLRRPGHMPGLAPAIGIERFEHPPVMVLATRMTNRPLAGVQP